MIKSTRDAPMLCEQRTRQALTVVAAALAVIVCAAIPGVRAAENYTQSMAQNAPQPSAPHMTAAEKEHALTEFMRRDAAGEKIDPSLLKAFIEAQNEGATTGIAIGQTAPAFELKDQHGRSLTLKSLMGPKGVLLVFTRSADW
jgi:AhpC/TSA family